MSIIYISTVIVYLFHICKLRQPVPNILPHRLRVISEENRISIPPKQELQSPLTSVYILRLLSNRLRPFRIQSNPDLPLLFLLILLPIQVHDGSV